MAVVMFGEWYCIFADEFATFEEIELCIEKKIKKSKFGGFFDTHLNKIAYVIRNRGNVVLKLKGINQCVPITDKQEIDFQTKGVAYTYMIGFFRNKTYHKGDLICVVSNNPDFIKEAKFYHRKPMFLKNMTHEEFLVKTFLKPIKEYLNIKCNEEKEDKERLEEKENKEHLEEKARINKIEEQERLCRVKIEEETKAHIAILEKETIELEKRKNIEFEDLKRVKELKQKAMEEELRLTNEILNRREELERLETEGNQKTIQQLMDVIRTGG